MSLEAEIPVMEKGQGQGLKDLPICWRPGKSPMMVQTGSFGVAPRRTESQERLRPETGASGREDGVGDVEGQQTGKGRWYMFWRR